MNKPKFAPNILRLGEELALHWAQVYKLPNQRFYLRHGCYNRLIEILSESKKPNVVDLASQIALGQIQRRLKNFYTATCSFVEIWESYMTRALMEKYSGAFLKKNCVGRRVVLDFLNSIAFVFSEDATTSDIPKMWGNVQYHLCEYK